MNHCLNIDGKMYISSHRAAEMTKYSNDYIGRLCRHKKIPARMVGRNWFVEQKAILNYKKIAEIESQNRYKDVSLKMHKDATYPSDIRPLIIEPIGWNIREADGAEMMSAHNVTSGNRDVVKSLSNVRDRISRLITILEPHATLIVAGLFALASMSVCANAVVNNTPIANLYDRYAPHALISSVDGVLNAGSFILGEIADIYTSGTGMGV